MSAGAEASGGLLLEARRLSLGRRARRRVLWLLRRVDFRLRAGAFHALIGASGSGKSQLVALLAGELSPEDPSWIVRGRLRWRHGLRVVTLFQEEGLFDDLSVRGNLALAGAGGDEAEALLARVGLEGCPDVVAALSGGQRRRLGLARALALRPDLLILDEPTAGLDPDMRDQILELLGRLHREAGGALAVLLVTHDVAAVCARRLADRVLLLEGGGRLLDLPAAEWDGRCPEPAPALETRSGSAAATALFLRVGCFAADLLALPAALFPAEPLAALGAAAARILDFAPFLAAAGAVLGAFTLHFALRQDPLQGAFGAEILAGAGHVLLAILLPLVVSLLYAAPAVSMALVRFSAMRRDRQFAALRALGHSPRRTLLAPLFWSHVIGLPFLLAAAAVAAVYGAWAADRFLRGTTFAEFAPAFLADFGPEAFGLLLLKGLGAALAIAFFPWRAAAAPAASPAELAAAARRAFVWTAAAILAWQGLLLLAAP